MLFSSFRSLSFMLSLLFSHIVSGTVKRLNKVFPIFTGRYAFKSSLYGNFQRKGFSICASANTGMSGDVAEVSEREQDLKHYIWPDKKVSTNMILAMTAHFFRESNLLYLT